MKKILIAIYVLGLLQVMSCSNSPEKLTKNELYFDTVYCKTEDRLEVSTMSGLEKQGVMKIYHKNYGEIGEKLFIHNKLMISRELGGDSLTAGYTYFYNLHDTLFPLGSITYDRINFQKLDIMCTYFQIEASDSVEFGQPYKLKIIGNIGVKRNFKLSLTLGELDSSFNLINKKANYTSDGKVLEFEILDYTKGINLLTGHLTYIENDEDITKNYRISQIDLPLIFYKQFVVIPSVPSK